MYFLMIFKSISFDLFLSQGFCLLFLHGKGTFLWSSFKYRCSHVMVWLRPATKVPRGRPSPRRGAEENGKKEAETGGLG